MKVADQVCRPKILASCEYIRMTGEYFSGQYAVYFLIRICATIGQYCQAIILINGLPQCRQYYTTGGETGKYQVLNTKSP
jgi:hypothetical protein